MFFYLKRHKANEYNQILFPLKLWLREIRDVIKLDVNRSLGFER